MYKVDFFSYSAGHNKKLFAIIMQIIVWKIIPLYL